MAITHRGQPISIEALDCWLPPAQSRARDAVTKARRLWPGVHAQVITEEILVAWTQLHWLGPSARTQRLINEILDAPEVPCHQRRTDTEGDSSDGN